MVSRRESGTTLATGVLVAVDVVVELIEELELQPATNTRTSTEATTVGHKRREWITPTTLTGWWSEDPRKCWTGTTSWSA
jgi:hypothetical protein